MKHIVKFQSSEVYLFFVHFYTMCCFWSQYCLYHGTFTYFIWSTCSQYVNIWCTFVFEIIKELKLMIISCVSMQETLDQNTKYHINCHSFEQLHILVNVSKTTCLLNGSILWSLFNRYMRKNTYFYVWDGSKLISVAKCHHKSVEIFMHSIV